VSHGREVDLSKMTFATKADGRKVPLELEKVKKTCIRAGYSIKLANEIVKIISEKIYDEISTRKIYKMILETLSKRGLIKVKYRYYLEEFRDHIFETIYKP